MPPLGRLRPVALALGAALSLTACSTSLIPVTRAPTAVRPTPATAPGTAAQAPANASCDPVASIRPSGPLPLSGEMPSGSWMAQILDRGRLIVGISQDTLMFGYLNPLNNQIEGFDIDLVDQISQAIFGDTDHIEYRVLTPAERIPALESGQVDMVAETLTMTCQRWQQIDFSTQYLQTYQSLLVVKGSPVHSLQDLGHGKVCAAEGTVAYQQAASAKTRPTVVGVTEPTDCLVLLQLGQVQAITAAYPILVGFTDQDPNLQIVGPPITSLSYGIGISKKHPDFVQFVNSVLEQMRSDGQWAQSYDRWLSQLGPAPTLPPAVYQ